MRERKHLRHLAEREKMMFEEVESFGLTTENLVFESRRINNVCGTGSLVAVSKDICEMGPCEIGNQYRV